MNSGPETDIGTDISGLYKKFQATKRQIKKKKKNIQGGPKKSL